MIKYYMKKENARGRETETETDSRNKIKLKKKKKKTQKNVGEKKLKFNWENGGKNKTES